MPKNQASGWILKSLSKSGGRGLILMLAQKLLVLRLRSQGKTSLKYQLLTTVLLLFQRGKEEKEKPLLLILKKG